MLRILSGRPRARTFNKPSARVSVVASHSSFVNARAGGTADARPAIMATIKKRPRQADRTFTLKNVEGLKLENVRIGGQRVNGRLDGGRPCRSSRDRLRHEMVAVILTRRNGRRALRG